MLALNARGALTASDLINASTVACTAGQFTQLGSYTVKAGEVVTVGYGQAQGQENAQGRIYVKLQNSTPTEVTGEVRLSILGPQNSVLREIARFRTEALSSSTDRTKQIPLPDSMIGASEDRKILMEFNPDSTATLTKANCTVLIDITRTLVS